MSEKFHSCDIFLSNKYLLELELIKIKEQVLKKIPPKAQYLMILWKLPCNIKYLMFVVVLLKLLFSQWSQSVFLHIQFQSTVLSWQSPSSQPPGDIIIIIKIIIMTVPIQQNPWWHYYHHHQPCRWKVNNQCVYFH